MSFAFRLLVSNMIEGIHAMFETPNAEELRAFIRDKLGFPYTDTGDGWLIFSMKEADIGCHPAEKNSHSISFYCNDIQKTVQELKSRGVEFTSGITDQSWGFLTHFRVPGGMEIDLYEPKYERRPARSSSKIRRVNRTKKKTKR
jgi:predicted enzyme related to lactoylglutathione lyase